MLAANAELDVGTGLATAFDTDPDQFAHAFAVNRHEGIGGQNTLRGVRTKETGRIIPRNAQTGLGQIIGAEGEEFG